MTAFYVAPPTVALYPSGLFFFFPPLTLLPSDNPPRVLGQLKTTAHMTSVWKKELFCCVRGSEDLRNDFVTLSSCMTAEHHRVSKLSADVISSQMSLMCCARAIASSRSLEIKKKKIYNFHDFIGCVSLSQKVANLFLSQISGSMTTFVQ